MFPLLLIFFISYPIFSLSQNIEQFTDCSTKLYSCGEAIRWIGYPFWGQARPSYCGLPEFHLTCRDDAVSTVRISNTTFRVIRVEQDNRRITLALDDLWDTSDACLYRQQESVNSTKLDYTFYSYIPDAFLFLGLYYSCSENGGSPVPIRNRLNCSGDGGERVSFFGVRSSSSEDIVCESEMSVPVLRQVFDEFIRGETTSLEEVLRMGFPVEYRVDGGDNCSRCQSSGGACWSGTNSSTPSCICPDGIPRLVCPTSGKGINLGMKLVIGLGSVAVSGIMLTCICCSIWRRNCLASLKHKSKDDRSVEAFIIQFGSLAPKRYNYSQIKKMTNSFKEKLGQGGFGSVFKGMLSDGRLVAVKVLNSSKASGQEFINEVASIGRTSHVNIIALLGFCYDGSKRALVYEFMPNGSLEKFNVPLKNCEHLGVKKLYEIALGTARGLNYLHRGCNTRILHLDIKPHNILLDEDFCPKIADFGLAKLYSWKESMVSILEARGTIGYIAPEVFSRNFGGVSHKSDVYSYGMMILEIVVGRKNVGASDASGDTSAIYFPHWIYNRLKKEDLQLEGFMTVDGNDFARKMILVGLWCIQPDPSQRPSINEVIEMLEGSMEALEVPPKPYFSSPPRSPTTTVSTLNSVSR